METPALGFVETENEQGMMWRIAVSGPETLLAAAKLEALEGDEIIDAVPEREACVMLSIERGRLRGYMERGAARSRTEAERLRRALRACAEIE